MALWHIIGKDYICEIGVDGMAEEEQKIKILINIWGADKKKKTKSKIICNKSKWVGIP